MNNLMHRGALAMDCWS